MSSLEKQRDSMICACVDMGTALAWFAALRQSVRARSVLPRARFARVPCKDSAEPSTELNVGSVYSHFSGVLFGQSRVYVF